MRGGTVWMVDWYNDLGHQEPHSWHLQGRTFLNGKEIGRFEWRVPSITNPRYEFPHGRPQTERL